MKIELELTDDELVVLDYILVEASSDWGEPLKDVDSAFWDYKREEPNNVCKLPGKILEKFAPFMKQIKPNIEVDDE